MTIEELGVILNDMYFNSAKGEAVAMIHLFGIKYADDIKSNGFSVSEIVIIANLNKSYCTEISKGIKLAKYVTVSG